MEALARRRSQNRRAELRDELVLDLPFGHTGVCTCLDEPLDVAGDRRVRLVERRLALRAHHLALEIGERRAGGRRGSGEGQRGDDGDEELHASSTSCTQSS